MHPIINQHRAAIADICARHRVTRLEIFGSAARSDDFALERSDLDFTVEFAPDAAPTLDSYFALREDLATLMGRPVDLVMIGAVRNPYIREAIERSRELVYAA